MFKRFKTSKLNIVAGVCAAVLLASSAVPAMAYDHFRSFGFNFDYGNTCVTETEYKSTTDAVTMKCTGSEDLSPYSYSATVCSDEGERDVSYNYLVGTFHTYQVPEYQGKGVYMEARLNGDDVDSFWGEWNPDDSRY